jgi:restriction system protein
MATLSPNQPVRRQVAAEVPAPVLLNPSRHQRTQAIVDLIRDATLAFAARFLARRDPLARELATVAAAAATAFTANEPPGPSAESEKSRLMACRQHAAHLLTTLELFIDQRRLRRWLKDDPEARQVRTVGQRASVGQVGHRSPAGTATYAAWLEQPDPGVVANTIVCLLHQVNYLLDRQIRLLAQGFKRAPESLPRGRSGPEEHAGEEAPQIPVPACPDCGLPMIERTARRGPRAGGRFWGCTAYPRCHGIRANAKAADVRPRP